MALKLLHQLFHLYLNIIGFKRKVKLNVLTPQSYLFAMPQINTSESRESLLLEVLSLRRNMYLKIF